MFRHRIIPIFVPHKGCPHDCIFCNQKKITGSDDDIDYDYVIRTIDSFISTMDKSDFIEVSFFGGSFTGIEEEKQEELLGAALKAKNEGKVKAIRMSTRPDYMGDAVIERLERYKVDVVELGVQSMDEEVLLYSERGHTVNDVRVASERLKRSGITLGLQMMTGLPKSSKEKDIYTCKEIIKLRPELVRIYPALTIKNTRMEELYKNGSYNPPSIDEAVETASEIYMKFVAAGIDVIRIGLQATDNINEGRDVAAGPFHPAFGEMVESFSLNSMLQYIIKDYVKEGDIVVRLSPPTLSKIYSSRKKYYNKFIADYDINVKFVQDNSVENLVILVNIGDFKRKMSLFEFTNLFL